MKHNLYSLKKRDYTKDANILNIPQNIAKILDTTYSTIDPALQY